MKRLYALVGVVLCLAAGFVSGWYVGVWGGAPLAERAWHLVALMCLAGGLIGGWYIGVSKGVPFVRREYVPWAIGIYEGRSPYMVSPSRRVRNPVLTARSVSDVRARLVADPFVAREDGLWYMFFEVMNRETNRGEIGLATSEDGLRWTYAQIVLREPFHLSYPYVFKWQDEYYMIPESIEAESVRLYKSVAFPSRWVWVANLLDNAYADPSVFRFADRWWMFVCSRPTTHDMLRLYHAEELRGPWIEHPASPIIREDAHIARPAGRVLVLGTRVIRYAQDDLPTYGNRVWAFEITELTTESYSERLVRPNPILWPTGSGPYGSGWNAGGMHHIDPCCVDENQWVACVDGMGHRLVFDWDTRRKDRA